MDPFVHPLYGPVDPQIRRLAEQHPRLFRGEPPAVWSDLAPGWYEIVHALCTKLEAAIPGEELSRLRISQIKEKHGALRFHVRCAALKTASITVARELIAATVAASDEACQVCGEFATLQDVRGTSMTLCRRHFTELQSAPTRNAQMRLEPASLGTVEAARQVLRTFFKIAKAWQLAPGEQEILIGVARSACDSWRDGLVASPLSGDTLERLGYILNIYAALRILLPIQERADAWMRLPNTSPLFGGEPALKRMLGGRVDDLKVVADYLGCAGEMEMPNGSQP